MQKCCNFPAIDNICSCSFPSLILCHQLRREKIVNKFPATVGNVQYVTLWMFPVLSNARGASTNHLSTDSITDSTTNTFHDKYPSKNRSNWIEMKIKLIQKHKHIRKYMCVLYTILIIFVLRICGQSIELLTYVSSITMCTMQQIIPMNSTQTHMHSHIKTHTNIHQKKNLTYWWNSNLIGYVEKLCRY